jgi:muramoyltetrapeptide carboxypeptidase
VSRPPHGAAPAVDADTANPASNSLTIFAASGVELRTAMVKRAATRLAAAGFSVSVDASVRARSARFAGDDDTRLATLYRVADAAPSVALACRGGYGLSRLLDRIDWKRLGASVERGCRWVGYSDLTALQLGLLAHTGATTWSGPMATEDFGADELDDVTAAGFNEAMAGELEGVGFRTAAGCDGLRARGKLWGGNLAMVCSLLGTAHWPRIKGGVLFLEDVNEHPYRVERSLLQLHQAGVLGAQKAVLLGGFSGWKKSPLDRGYTLKSAVAHLRSVCPTPILTGLPFGHVPTKVMLPIGAKVELVVEGRDVLIGW